MGYIKNHCIVVSGHNERGEVTALRETAVRILKQASLPADLPMHIDYSKLVSPVIPHLTNGGASFFVGVDGSKEGWRPSDDCDAARAEFIHELRRSSVEWALIILGGDDARYEFEDLPRGADAQ